MVGGPTGIGKSDIAVRLALRYNGIIVGADSVQIYRGMDIGSGKVSEKEKCGIPHTMIDIVYPNESYSVQKYCNEAQKVIERAHAQHKTPIVVGGTGLYLNALIHRQNFADAQPNAELRAQYVGILQKYGEQYLHDLLREVDENSADKIAVNDTKRVIRALEIYAQTGKRKSENVSSVRNPYDIKFYILQTVREKLYAKIDARVEKMFHSGLVEEVVSLRDYWEYPSMQAIGYKEIICALQNNTDPCAAMQKIQQNTRRYAKRQISFLKWIQAEKTYVSENFYTNILATADEWIEKE